MVLLAFFLFNFVCLIDIPIRYTALSFRNPEEFSNLDLQMRSRIAPLRNRREARSKRLSNGTIIDSSNSVDAKNDTMTTRVILPVDDKQKSTEIDIQRSKRETPECVINYNSARQLFIGCSQSNVVEVKPHCSDDGDEGSFSFCSIFFISSVNNNSFLFSVQLSRFMDWKYNHIYSGNSFRFTACRLHKLSTERYNKCSTIRGRFMLSINAIANIRSSFVSESHRNR